MAIPMLGSVAEGLSSGVALDCFKRNEASALAGRDVYIPAGLQCVQAQIAMGMVDQVAGEIPLAARLVVYLTPLAIAALSKMGIENDTVREIVLFIQNQIGNLCHLVSAVCAVMLIQFGFVASGAATLAVLALGFACRQGWLPSSVRQPFNYASNFLMVPLGAVYGTWGQKLYAFAFLLMQCWNAYMYFTTPEVTCIVPKGALTPALLKEILAGNQTLEMNKDYVRQPTLAPAPDVDVRKAYELFDQINWENPEHMKALRAKLKGDRKYVEEQGDPASKSDAELIEYAKTRLHRFIESVMQRQILEGEPRDYTRMEHYLKIIVDHLVKEKNEKWRADVIMRLIVDGGEYCGPGKFELVEDLYKLIVPNMENLSFELKVLNLFQDMRDNLVRGIYDKLLQVLDKQGASMTQIVDLRDLHQFNIIMNVYAERLGIRKAGADNDSVALVDDVARAIGYHTAGKYIEKGFWSLHNRTALVKECQANLGQSRLPIAEFYAWWSEWIERQEIEPAEKAALQNALIGTSPQLFDQPLQDAPQLLAHGGWHTPVQGKFIQAMLVDMGILQARAVQEGDEALEEAELDALQELLAL